MINWSEEELTYLAGYLDGEGCFWVGRDYKVGISCANSHRPTIEWLHRTFGGSFRIENRKRKQHHRRMFVWQVVSRDAGAVCAAVIPYLKEKMPQALLLIALRQTMLPPGRKILRLPVFLREERDRLVNIFQGMKHVAW